MQPNHALLREYASKVKGLDAESPAMAEVVAANEPHRAEIVGQAAKNWEVGDDLAISLLGNGRCFEQYQSNSTQARLGLAFEILHNNRTAGFHRIKRLSSAILTEGGSQCKLVLLAEISVCINQSLLPSAELSVLLPAVLKTLGMILQRYIMNKQEKASSTQDRLETDLSLFENCEKWVSQGLLKFASAVSKNCTQQPPSRKFYLSFCCDSIEALIRNLADGTLSGPILTKTLSELVEITQQHFALTEIVQEQCRLLKVSRHYGQALKEIEIPERYLLETELNRAGAAYLVSRYLLDPATGKFYSKAIITKALLLAASEAALTSYPFRMELLRQLSSHVRDTQPLIRSDFEYSYPISSTCERLLTLSAEEPSSKELIDPLLSTFLTPDVAEVVLNSHHSKQVKLLLDWLRSNQPKAKELSEVLKKVEPKLEPSMKAELQAVLNN